MTKQNDIKNAPSMATSTSQGAQGFATGEPSMEVAMATKMQLVLDQPMSDITTKLVNNDFEGDFFKIGDTVSIVKPSLDSVEVELDNLATGAHARDAKLTPTDIDFSKSILTINKYAKYAFVISDITKAEGKWNYESGNLDLAAHKIRKAHNLETCQQLVDGMTADKVTVLNSGSAIAIHNGDELYENVLLKMHTELYDTGAITSDGQVTYGSNAQQAKSTKGGIFLPKQLYNEFLKSKYFVTNRGTVEADKKVETGDVARVLGLEVAIEPALAPVGSADGKHVVISAVEANEYIIVAGTRNAITRAGKVLPPEKQRSQNRFATEFHGMEIYGQEITTKEAVVVARVKLV